MATVCPAHSRQSISGAWGEVLGHGGVQQVVGIPPLDPPYPELREAPQVVVHIAMPGCTPQARSCLWEPPCRCWGSHAGTGSVCSPHRMQVCRNGPPTPSDEATHLVSCVWKVSQTPLPKRPSLCLGPLCGPHHCQLAALSGAWHCEVVPREPEEGP